MFYQVTAYVGDLEILLAVIKKGKSFNLGELEKLIRQEKKLMIESDQFNGFNKELR